jgi:hypothetical protein
MTIWSSLLHRIAQEDSHTIYFIFLGSLFYLLWFLEVLFIFWQFRKTKFGIGPHSDPRVPPSQAGSPRDLAGRIVRVCSVLGPSTAAETGLAGPAVRRTVRAQAMVTACGAPTMARLSVLSRLARRKTMTRMGTREQWRVRQATRMVWGLTEMDSPRWGSGSASVRQCLSAVSAPRRPGVTTTCSSNFNEWSGMRGAD